MYSKKEFRKLRWRTWWQRWHGVHGVQMTQGSQDCRYSDLDDAGFIDSNAVSVHDVS